MLLIGTVFIGGFVAAAVIAPQRLLEYKAIVMYPVLLAGLLCIGLALTNFSPDVVEVDLRQRQIRKYWNFLGRVTRTIEVDLENCSGVRVGRTASSTGKTYVYHVKLGCNDPRLDESSIELVEYTTHEEAKRTAETVAAKTGLLLHDPYA